uniref:Uncharacterized protein n=1 Tax=Utricularia reniformis TaxID=192314 RepID=A0A1Y0B0Y8_9LAMI|nr:hypothetical protein AEK19_MT0884 [Utricularia reniformis]ART31115.1 hypothetical protein AEK19_MT0884 [Utricularia reniformis]
MVFPIHQDRLSLRLQLRFSLSYSSSESYLFLLVAPEPDGLVVGA